MTRKILRFIHGDEAATAVEYAVVLALILMVVFSAVMFVGQQTSQSWSNSNTALKAVNFGS